MTFSQILNRSPKVKPMSQLKTWIFVHFVFVSQLSLPLEKIMLLINQNVFPKNGYQNYDDINLYRSNTKKFKISAVDIL